MSRTLIILASLLAVLFAANPAAQAEEPVCPEGTHGIYTAEGVLVSCEELIGSPESCPDDALPGYLEDGTLVGCFTASLETEEICTPVGTDTDEDMLDDGCDPCPEDPDCDGDGFCDGLEAYLGTDLLDACPDDATDDAWPADTNMSTTVNVLDLFLFLDHLGTEAGDIDYDRRLDLNASGTINVLDLFRLVPVLGADCNEVGGAGERGFVGCFACMDWPVRTVDLHIEGEFNWTIPIPWLPDLVSTKYRMNLRASFTWLNQLNIAGLGHTNAWAEAWTPYRISDPTITVTTNDDFTTWTLKALANVTFLAPPVGSDYPARLWIYFWMPGEWSGDGSGFHHWWIHEE